ncbi:MAG: ribonucleotide reductase subunit alpha [Ramlibacter sp.]|nr:ribonucleotide reductase subunit alpha [Ramlibacter sp.]
MPSASHFDQLLKAAAAQPDPQRLLFVFAQAELPEGATEEQRKNFVAGKGGALTPLACVDKAPADLSTFDALVDESRNACPPWQVLFVAALAGQDGKPPSTALVDSALHAMVEAVKAGRFGSYMALSPNGEPLVMS